MDESFLPQALEWFERGDHDREGARILLDAKGHTDVIGMLIQQAVEKYLKGYLVLFGKRPPKVHDLDFLLHQAEIFDHSLEAYIDFCEKATRYYLEDRYPPGPAVDYSFLEVENDLRTAGELIRTIRKKAGLER
jgi:HEPN domain-containing protein